MTCVIGLAPSTPPIAASLPYAAFPAATSAIAYPQAHPSAFAFDQTPSTRASKRLCDLPAFAIRSKREGRHLRAKAASECLPIDPCSHRSHRPYTSSLALASFLTLFASHILSAVDHRSLRMFLKTTLIDGIASFKHLSSLFVTFVPSPFSLSFHFLPFPSQFILS